jgi:hypothetical protein
MVFGTNAGAPGPLEGALLGTAELFRRQDVLGRIFHLHLLSLSRKWQLFDRVTPDGMHNRMTSNKRLAKQNKYVYNPIK